MPFGFGSAVFTGTSTPPTISACSSIESFTILGYLEVQGTSVGPLACSCGDRCDDDQGFGANEKGDHALCPAAHSLLGQPSVERRDSHPRNA